MRAALGAAFIALAALTGCQGTLVTGVQADRDGSGRVSAGLGLDDEALKELGDPVAELRLDDLRQAGWAVTAPQREGGLTWVRATKRFETPERLAAVAGELGGPFGDFRLSRSRSFFKTAMAFTGVVDLTGRLAGLSDADLDAKLGDAPLPADPGSVRIRVDVRLPGRHATFEPAVGQRLEMEVNAETWNLVPVVPAALAGALLLAAGAVALGARRRR